MARSYLGVEFGKSTHVEYAVYNRNTKNLCFDMAYAGLVHRKSGLTNTKMQIIY